jgi:glycosyltransferase involved in cell wall biosynthesis
MPPDPSSAEPTLNCVIVVPCYNEATRLPTKTFLSYLADRPEINFLFVNDGSKDDTEQVLAELCSQSPARLSKLSLTRNSGKAEAVRQGLLTAIDRDPEIVGFWGPRR